MREAPDWIEVEDFGYNEPGFAAGFECGRLWLILGLREPPIVEFAHNISAHHIKTLTEAYSCDCAVEDLGEGWVELTFSARNPDGQTA